MPPLPRPAAALRASQTLLRPYPTATTNGALVTRANSIFQTPQRKIVSISVRAASTHSGSQEVADHGEFSDAHSTHDMTEPPQGWLWGIPPGEEYKKEGWENIWYYGFYGSLIVAAVAYAFKPDTSIETWALEEAKRRLQAEGTLPEDE